MTTKDKVSVRCLIHVFSVFAKLKIPDLYLLLSFGQNSPITMNTITNIGISRTNDFPRRNFNKVKNCKG